MDIGSRGYQRYSSSGWASSWTPPARWEESVDIILKAFSGQPFTYDGKLFKVPETSVFPQPLQKPHPPIWVTAQSPESVEAAVHRGFNVLTGGFGVPIERMAEFRKLFDRAVAESRLPRTPEVGVQRAVYVTHSESDARAAAEEARWNMRVTLSLRNHYERVERGRAIAVPAPKEPDVDDLLDRFLIIGTAGYLHPPAQARSSWWCISHFNCSFGSGDLEHGRVLLDGALRARGHAGLLLGRGGRGHFRATRGSRCRSAGSREAGKSCLSGVPAAQPSPPYQP